MKKLLLAFFLFGFVLINAQNKDTFLLKEENRLWDLYVSQYGSESIKDDSIFSLIEKERHFYATDTLFSNDTIKIISVMETRTGDIPPSYLFCSKFGKQVTYIGLVKGQVGWVKNAYYHNGILSFLDYKMNYYVFERKKGVFENKVCLYCGRDKCNAYKSNLTSPFVLDMYLLNKDAPIRYFVDLEGKKIMRADLDYYEEQYFPFVNGKIALAIK